jgi:hypothetical protein
MRAALNAKETAGARAAPRALAVSLKDRRRESILSHRRRSQTTNPRSSFQRRLPPASGSPTAPEPPCWAFRAGSRLQSCRVSWLVPVAGDYVVAPPGLEKASAPRPTISVQLVTGRTLERASCLAAYTRPGRRRSAPSKQDIRCLLCVPSQPIPSRSKQDGLGSSSQPFSLHLRLPSACGPRCFEEASHFIQPLPLPRSRGSNGTPSNALRNRSACSASAKQ